MKITTHIGYGLAYLSVHINRTHTQEKKELKILWYHHFKNYKLKNYSLTKNPSSSVSYKAEQTTTFPLPHLHVHGCITSHNFIIQITSPHESEGSVF